MDANATQDDAERHKRNATQKDSIGHGGSDRLGKRGAQCSNAEKRVRRPRGAGRLGRGERSSTRRNAGEMVCRGTGKKTTLVTRWNSLAGPARRSSGRRPDGGTELDNAGDTRVSKRYVGVGTGTTSRYPGSNGPRTRVHSLRSRLLMMRHTRRIQKAARAAQGSACIYVIVASCTSSCSSC